MSAEQLGIWIMVFILSMTFLLLVWGLFHYLQELWREVPGGWWRHPYAWVAGICLVLAALTATRAATSYTQTKPEPAIPYPEQGWPDGRAFQGTPLTGGFSEPPE